MPPPRPATDPTSHRTVGYFPHPTPYRYFKNLIFLLCLITKIIDPNYDFTHYPNKLVDIYTSNRTLDLSPIPFGTVGASILFPPIPLPGFPTPTCEDQQCRYEPAAADRNLAEWSRQELWRQGQTGVARLGRGVGEWYEGSVLAGVFSSHKNLSLSLDEIGLLNSSASATISTLTSTCERARGAYLAYRAGHPISPDSPWIHWLSRRLNDGLHSVPCPYLDYAFIGIVLRDVLAFLARAGYVVTLGLVSLLVVACRRYLPPYSTLPQTLTRAVHRIPFLNLIPQLLILLFTTYQFILRSAVYVLLSAHSLFTMIFGIPPVLSSIQLYWFGHRNYRWYYPSTSLPVLLCGTLFWLGFLATWRISAPIFGLLFSASLALIKYTYFSRQATRRVRYYYHAYARASRMVGPYLSYLARQALVDLTMLLVYFTVGTWIRDEFWDAVVPNWVKYSPTIGILVGYLGIRYALSGRHPSARWVFRGLGRSEVIGVGVMPLRGELYDGWW
ncbi:hypothetical protein B9Z19DRAFT_1129491 [Tuber borchii]|uniref:Uncharacterized protein n=1 Tax=Tuber borchii TaxID=42251 RepID=A0A2T6ZMD6_TUBBO|nr:hypothetical protein B9Z19DRAFT_1129491 [Tuber borchii]